RPRRPRRSRRRWMVIYRSLQEVLMFSVGGARRLCGFRSRSAVVAVTLLLVASSWGGGARHVQAQERRQVFVSVMEPTGVPVMDLKAEDVKVFEDQVLATTAKVELIDWPMKLTVLVDNGQRSPDYLSALRT